MSWVRTSYLLSAVLNQQGLTSPQTHHEAHPGGPSEQVCMQAAYPSKLPHGRIHQFTEDMNFVDIPISFSPFWFILYKTSRRTDLQVPSPCCWSWYAQTVQVIGLKSGSQNNRQVDTKSFQQCPMPQR